jgi:hypothetical protein
MFESLYQGLLRSTWPFRPITNSDNNPVVDVIIGRRNLEIHLSWLKGYVRETLEVRQPHRKNRTRSTIIDKPFAVFWNHRLVDYDRLLLFQTVSFRQVTVCLVLTVHRVQMGDLEVEVFLNCGPRLWTQLTQEASSDSALHLKPYYCHRQRLYSI